MSTIEVDELISRLGNEDIEFSEIIRIIDKHYDYKPSGFRNGLGDKQLDNPAGSNEGSCKVFAFGMIHNLVDEAVLGCFGEHYRQVQSDPHGDSHQNIRNFMEYSWTGIEFDDLPLRLKSN